jgi:hypothetical protein
MSDDKLLHVSCIVRQPMLWDLLRVLEGHKVGNVEVRPVAPVLALPAPDKAKRQANGKKKQGVVQPKVRAAMAIKQERSAADIAKEIGEKKQSVHSAIAVMITQGVAKRVGYGTYMRTKPDPITTTGANT